MDRSIGLRSKACHDRIQQTVLDERRDRDHAADTMTITRDSLRRSAALGLLVVASMFTPAIGAGLGGTWSGIVTQSEPNTTYAVEMELYGMLGSINYPSLKCGGKLEFLREEGKIFFYRETLTFGKDRCIDGGTVQISPHPLGDSTLWNWRWDGGGVSVRGVIKGSGTRKP